MLPGLVIAALTGIPLLLGGALGCSSPRRHRRRRPVIGRDTASGGRDHALRRRRPAGARLPPPRAGACSSATCSACRTRSRQRGWLAVMVLARSAAALAADGGRLRSSRRARLGVPARRRPGAARVVALACSSPCRAPATCSWWPFVAPASARAWSRGAWARWRCRRGRRRGGVAGCTCPTTRHRRRASIAAMPSRLPGGGRRPRRGRRA